MKDNVTQGQDSFRDLTRQCCFWLSWPKDDPAWEWLYRVVWADVHQNPRPLYELLLLSAERPPQQAVPFVHDFLLRSTLGKTKRGPKRPLWYCGTWLEAGARMVNQCINKDQGITLSVAVDLVLDMEVDPGPFWLELEEPAEVTRDTLYDYCNSKTGQAWRKKKQMKELQNPPKFIAGPKMARPN